MDVKYCKSLLESFARTNTKHYSSLSKFLKDAWWDKKKECLIVLKKKMWDEFLPYIKNLMNNNFHLAANEKLNSTNSYVEIEDPSLIDKKENSVYHKVTHTSQVQDDSFSISNFMSPILYWAKIIWLTILIIILIIFFWKIIKYIFAFIYDVFNKRRYIRLRVVLPRWDTKFDREKEKEIAKDMKEKIARMAQVYRNIHKLWELSVWDNIMNFLFSKPKVTLALHYENGLLYFIVWTYPEYRKIIESAIAAQYPDASIEGIEEPRFFKYKYYDIMPLHPVKDSVYPIRIFKQLEDDPLNNILDAIWKISNEDTFTVQLIIKPAPDSFNERAKKFADAKYKKDISVLESTKWRKKILMPWKFIDFLIYWPNEKLIKRFAPGAKQWDPFIRMVKAEEEALNIMWEEAWKQAFYSGLLLITSSDRKDRLVENMNNVVSAYSIYKDEYNNELDQPEFIADLFWFIFKPLWKFASIFNLIGFFYRKNIFTINELASLYHFPDWLYNRSPIIKWMDYKVLPAPDNLPVLKEKNEKYKITWVIAEEYKKWNLSKIFEWVKHRAVTKKKVLEEKLVPIEEYKWTPTKDQIVEKNWQKFVKVVEEKWEVPALQIFKDGVLLGINVYRNKFTPVYIKRKDRTRHHYIIWKSGWGKSAFISFLARQDVWNGDWLCVIDPHGDLVEDILTYIPKERARDVIYFDAWNEERPMWLNLYEIDSIDQADRVVNDATEIFLKMFGPEIFGPRIQEYFKYWSLTLLEDLEEWATLIDVPRLFTDEAFREYKVKKVKNPVVRNFWERTYNAMWEREKQEIIPYFTSKFVSFITNRLIRNIIWQTKSAFRFRQIMDEGKILLVNLSKWKIWELNAQLLWMILVSQIYNAAMSRADIPEEQRRDFYLYVDEFQNFVTWTFADILSEARKYHLSLIMAHQYIAQLEWWWGNNIWEGKWWKNSVKDAVFGNVGTMQSFKVGAPDAEFLEKEYAPVLSAQDIIWISNYKVYIKLNINNATSRVFSMDTIWSTDYKNPRIAEVLKEYSAKKYWRKREFVEAEIAARLWMLEDETDI
jgi:hypothetical protein